MKAGGLRKMELGLWIKADGGLRLVDEGLWTEKGGIRLVD